ncbi:uncharacterized protein LOC105703852 isoform X2 [Orussus abietinus]|uniref:uncharacterized protein LOC105703852 isoform X2 n=1 Tax=Orussus abietinus TaxID=222816 RepID=UPI0006253B5D|nr:uncharacterized protein LOC105703852 isoform X2 [Orussus abietinus]
MSTVDTAPSISVDVAAGSDHLAEPVTSNQSPEEPMEIDVDTEDLERLAPESAGTNTEPGGLQATLSDRSTLISGSLENKQEEPATLSTLNEGELRALLDEAFAYKCPKDREGKSSLFKELLQEVEADETQEGRRTVNNSRCLPGSNRRRHKRDSVSERLTHGGSLQNLAQPLNSEFDSSFAYLTSGSSHTYGGGRRKGKKHTGPSVSARQREGGSLPSNVDASHSLASLANLDLLFDKKGFSEERSSYDWTNKEKSRSLDKSSYGGPKKDEKDKDKKDAKRETGDPCEAETENREKRGTSRGKQGTNEMLESDNPPPEYKPDYTVIDLSDAEVRSIGENNVAAIVAGAQRILSNETGEDEGTEMKIIDPRRSIQTTTRATFDVPQTPVDTTIEFPIREHNGKQGKPKVSVNGPEAVGTLPFQTSNSIKCAVGGSSNGSSAQQAKVPHMYSVMPWSPSNIGMEVARLTAAPHITGKDSSASGEKKSLDENGNAVQGYNGERKKPRRKHTQEPNVIVYKAENVKGHRNDDIDSLINFIENKESKGKKGKTGNAVRVKSSSGAKPRTREKDSKREQLSAKLQKSNSLEEISKTKLEDLTAEKSSSSSGASSVSSQQGTINVALRRAKQRSTGDATVDCRGDRRSWGTEEGQSIYCNDTGDDYATRRNSNKKINPDPEPEPEFLVVTKKKKSKKRRSSSGSRAQNLANSGSYLQRSRGFPNEYRTPLSPELRRKSASSMPPSDKSDSSDLDSVHSLPVTSNTVKHSLTKNATSSGGTPQASYADITRMPTINVSPSSVLNMAAIVPNVLNVESWPTVPFKAPSEPDKLPQDYYPSLDELQQSDRKLRQHNFSHSNHVPALNLGFEKPPSPTLSKTKGSPESKTTDAQEEAFNKNFQVFKYVQDIEKMHRSLSQQDKNTSSNNSSPSSSETASTNPSPPKINSIPNYVSTELDNNHSQEPTSGKDANLNARGSNPRARRGFQQNVQSLQNQSHNEEQRDSRKPGNPHPEDAAKKLPSNQSPNDDSAKKAGSPRNVTPGPLEDSDTEKSRLQTSLKSLPRVQMDLEYTAKPIKTDRTLKVQKEPQQNACARTEPSKSNSPTQNAKVDQQQQDQPQEEGDARRSVQQNCLKVDKESAKIGEAQIQGRKTSSRPAVILLDDTSSDVTRNSDSPCELTFGFEINEQLLLSEESDENPTAGPGYKTNASPLFDKPPPNYDRPPPMFDKHIRFDKVPPNFHMQPPHGQVHHPVHHGQVMGPPLPYMGYPQRFHPAHTYLPSTPPPPPPPGIVDKYRHPPKEDFCARFVAPEEAVNVQNYNHDKIVTFVGTAWNDVISEMPVPATNGRVQYYSGQ